MTNLKGELIAATHAINEVRWRQLRSLGVGLLTAASLRGRGQAAWGVMTGSAGEDGLFVLDAGPPHLVLPVIMDGELIDIVAFRSGGPNDWLLRTGLGWALGLDCGLEPFMWSTVPTLHETPLDWLRADCEGLCILDWSAPEIHSLKGLEKVACATGELAATLRRHLTRDPHLPQIVTVPHGTERRAA